MNKLRLIVVLKGGLGNQMFQYAAGRALAIRNSMELVLDTTSGFIRDKVYRRSFSLSAFPIQVVKAGFLDQLPFWFKQARQKLAPKRLDLMTRHPWGDFLYEAELVFMDKVTTNKLRRTVWMEGYWQSEKYFADCKGVIAREYELPTPTESDCLSMGRAIQSCNSVAVGVRIFEDMPVTDKTGVGGFVPLSFYERAACRIADTVNSPTFFVFCTTISSIKDKLRLPGEIHYITPDKGFNGALDDLWLISQCKHFIISNSSFYWWGAWLAEYHNPDATIIVSDLFSNKDSIPARWIRFDALC